MIWLLSQQSVLDISLFVTPRLIRNEVYALINSDESFTQSNLLALMGVPPNFDQDDVIKCRCFVPISDGCAHERMVSDQGTHWSLLVLETTKAAGSNHLDIRGVHFNSMAPPARRTRRKDGQLIVVEKIKKKINSILDDTVCFETVIEAENIPRQQDGFSSGDHVIDFARSLAGEPFMSDVGVYATCLNDSYDASYVAQTRVRLKETLNDRGVSFNDEGMTFVFLFISRGPVTKTHFTSYLFVYSFKVNDLSSDDDDSSSECSIQSYHDDSDDCDFRVSRGAKRQNGSKKKKKTPVKKKKKTPVKKKKKKKKKGGRNQKKGSSRQKGKKKKKE